MNVFEGGNVIFTSGANPISKANSKSAGLSNDISKLLSGFGIGLPRTLILLSLICLSTASETILFSSSTNNDLPYILRTRPGGTIPFLKPGILTCLEYFLMAVSTAGL